MTRPQQATHAYPAKGGARDERVAVVDIGSNSIRLVVFDGLKRAPATVFNEKVLCGLGRGLHASGRLSPEGVALAVPNLVRFTALARAMGVRSEEHTSELQSLLRNSYAVFCLKTTN